MHAAEKRLFWENARHVNINKCDSLDWIVAVTVNPVYFPLVKTRYYTNQLEKGRCQFNNIFSLLLCLKLKKTFKSDI